MPHAFTILLATAAAGLIAGADAHTFLAASLAAAAAAWLARLARPFAHDLYANLDPEAPDGALLIEALRSALALLSRTQQPVRLRIAAFLRSERYAFTLSVNRSADLELAGGARPLALGQPGVWLPDHPLPLSLPRSRSLALLLEPCGHGRVRASLASGRRPPVHWSAPLLLAGLACMLDLDWLLAAALGFAFQAYLLDHQPERAAHDPEI